MADDTQAENQLELRVSRQTALQLSRFRKAADLGSDSAAVSLALFLYQALKRSLASRK
jgi:hypothetical protein